MTGAPTRRPVRASATFSPGMLLRWTLAVAVAITLAYSALAVATLRDVVDGVPVSALDAAWPFWVATLALAVAAGVLAQLVIQMARPKPPPAPPSDLMPFVEDQQRGRLAWILPVTTALAAVLLVRLYNTTLAAAVGAVAVLIATGGTILTHYYLRDDRQYARWMAGIGLAVLTHASAFFVLTMIYSNKWRSLYSAVAIALATTLLLIQLSDGAEIAWLRRLLYALIGGLLVGQATWALNYWAAIGWTGGALLFVLFYAIAELTRHAIAGRLQRRILIELGIVLVVAFIVLAISASLDR